VRNVAIIFSREFTAYLWSPITYVVIAVFLLLCGTFFTSYLAATGYSDTSLKGFLDAGQLLVPLFAAVLTMRLIAEEKKLGTWEFLATAPVRDYEIVLGKFSGGLAVLAAMLALSLYFPLLLFLFGDPDPGPIFTGYVGLLLLGGAALAIGTFASSITTNQIVAATASCALLFGLWFVGDAAAFVPQPFSAVLSYISLSSHFPDLAKGIIDTRAVVYYLAVAVLFLYFATRALEAGRWR
jgi:ABC-2 type transport system permease protein